VCDSTVHFDLQIFGRPLNRILGCRIMGTGIGCFLFMAMLFNQSSFFDFSVVQLVALRLLDIVMA
jgi:hypothetical protein